MKIDLMHEMYENLYILLCTLVSYLFNMYTHYDKVLTCNDKVLACDDKVLACDDKVLAYDIIHDVLRCLLIMS